MVCSVNTKKILESAEALLFIFLIVALALTAFVFFFVFCINWEDWFFGIKLDGLPAGLWLFAKMAGAVVILCLMAYYPRYRRQSVLLVFGYYGLLCLDSLVTIQKNTQGRDYPVLMAALFVIAVLLLIVHGMITMRGESVTGDAPCSVRSPPGSEESETFREVRRGEDFK